MDNNLRDYLETLLFTTCEEEFPEYCYGGDFSASEQDLKRFDRKSIARSEAELNLFERLSRPIVGWDGLGSKWPREFAYSRNGHGTGFFDSDDNYTEDQKDKLQDLARSFGETYVNKYAGVKSIKCKISID